LLPNSAARKSENAEIPISYQWKSTVDSMFDIEKSMNRVLQYYQLRRDFMGWRYY